MLIPIDDEMKASQILALLRQLDRMAINGWSEGIDPRKQCGNIHQRIAEFVTANVESFAQNEEVK